MVGDCLNSIQQSTTCFYVSDAVYTSYGKFVIKEQLWKLKTLKVLSENESYDICIILRYGTMLLDILSSSQMASRLLYFQCPNWQ